MEKKYKVVYNSAVNGGLILSSEAVAWLREHGYTGPLESDELLEWDPIIRDNLIPRHHPLLVECVEMLGERASGYSQSHQNGPRLGLSKKDADNCNCLLNKTY